MAPRKSCLIEIQVPDCQRRKVYTSGSIVAGVVLISPHHDITTATLDISFRGESKIVVGSEGETRTTEHRFLSLKMPALHEYLPETRVLKAQATYTIPFNFTVPYGLSINACRHPCSHLDVTEKHARLPPTVGCCSKYGKTPRTTRIQYTITAAIVGKYNGATTGSQAYQTIHVLPHIPEDPPLELSPSENKHGSTTTKDIRDRCFKAPVGSLKASARQPHAIALAADGCGALGSWVCVDFDFVPSRPRDPPPQVHVKSVKILSTTLFTTTAFSQIPQSSEAACNRAAETASRRHTHTALHLSQEHINWTPHYAKHEQGPNSRASPAVGPESPGFVCDKPQRPVQDTCVPTRYTASLRIPFTLRGKRGVLLLPTFHSCFISRIYVLQLKFSAGASSIDLVVPLHICVEKSCDQDVGELPTFESVLVQNEEARQQLLCTTSEMGTQTAVVCSVLPPEYEAQEA